MSQYRSYFSKGNTIIKFNKSNNSQNPVTEISYGTSEDTISRYIFDIDFSGLFEKIENGEINPNNITSHKLKLYNTIAYYDNKSTKSYDSTIDRASSFILELFNIDESWDEGNGYEFNYIDTTNDIPVNWYDRKVLTPWAHEGIVYTGSTILGEQYFQNGSENIEIDLSNYVNEKINEYLTGGTTGTTFSYGIGIKFKDQYESKATINRQAVAFHTNHTHTFFEPYIETIINDIIEDDRNLFYRDKLNRLYLTTNNSFNITVDSVDIIDNNENLIATFTGDTIVQQSKGVYYIEYTVSSLDYPDKIIFYDNWNLTINNQKNKTIEQSFYIKNDDMLYLNNSENLLNYYLSMKGILINEKIEQGTQRKLSFNVKKLYESQDDTEMIDIQYRIFVKQTESHIIDVIPFTKANRIFNRFEAILDTSWMIPQDYYIEVKYGINNIYMKNEPIRFKIFSDSIY